jgi:hypothetical protein
MTINGRRVGGRELHLGPPASTPLLGIVTCWWTSSGILRARKTDRGSFKMDQRQLCERCGMERALAPSAGLDQWLTGDVGAEAYVVHIAFTVRRPRVNDAKVALCLNCHRAVIAASLAELATRGTSGLH